MRIVFDTNVLFSAFITHGVCAGLYEECIDCAQIVVSSAILAELEEKLRAKAHFARVEAREIVQAVRRDALVVRCPSLPIRVCRGPDDDLVLATALSASADAIVTGDQVLLILKKFEGVRILNPRECLVLLAKKQG